MINLPFNEYEKISLLLDSSLIITMEGKGQLDKNEQEHFFFYFLIVRASLHRGKVYKLILPSIDVDIHKLRSLLQCT